MAYATLQDLIDRYGEVEITQLTDRAEPPAGTYSASVAGKALDDASADIDWYLALRYTLPVTDPAALAALKSLCCPLARVRLYRDGPPDRVKDDAANAVKILHDLASGMARLPIDGGDEDAAPAAKPAVAGPGLVMTRDNLSGWGQW